LPESAADYFQHTSSRYRLHHWHYFLSDGLIWIMAGFWAYICASNFNTWVGLFASPAALFAAAGIACCLGQAVYLALWHRLTPGYIAHYQREFAEKNILLPLLTGQAYPRVQTGFSQRFMERLQNGELPRSFRGRIERLRELGPAMFGASMGVEVRPPARLIARPRSTAAQITMLALFPFVGFIIIGVWALVSPGTHLWLPVVGAYLIIMLVAFAISNIIAKIERYAAFIALRELLLGSDLPLPD
jgi:hypothetical protein